jgi:molybdenum cofactor biosynthesis protein B
MYPADKIDNYSSHGVVEPEVVHCHVLTVSDTRTLERDESGKIIVQYLQKSGHQIQGRSLLPDDPEGIRRHLQEVLRNPKVDVVITTGGTGIAYRDSTYEVVWEFLVKRLDGFGELFRQLSYEVLGARAMLSRATGGITSEGIVMFSLPGSKKAVDLAMKKLIGPVLKHTVGLAKSFPRD